jgi:omega-hydroxy-beta-dihydromenaquinone-9 sulfotransferase
VGKLTTTRDPLFIIGTGRCGSTVFHDLLAQHPRVTWLSHLTNRHPTRPQLNSLLLKFFAVPGADRILRKQWYPVEAYRFWDHYYRGFGMPYRDLFAEDLFPGCIEPLRAAARACVTPARPHLLCKITGWPRLGFLNTVYPQAKFINVIRDGRAVAASLLRVKFWRGWHGPDSWGWGPLSTEQNERWKGYRHSFVALAGLQWEILMDAYERTKHIVPPERMLEVRYEELCADPIGVTRRAADFAVLDFPEAFQRRVERLRLESRNDKWKQGLSAEQQGVLNECIRGPLSRWGY